MALKIFGTDPETQPKPRQSFADDVVGRFRAGYVLDGRPATVNEWLVTTGDPDVADVIFDLFGGEAPEKYETKGEDNLRVFTASTEIEVVIGGPKDLRQKMVMFNRAGKLVQSGDGETIDYPEDLKGQPDPDAELTFQERKKKGQDGFGPTPQTELYFRLAADKDLGIFKFQSGSWGLAYDVAAEDLDGQLAAADGPVKAILKLEPVSFIAKNGPRAGQTVSYTKSSITITGPAE